MRNKYAVVSDPNTFVTNCGDTYRDIYSPVVMPDGTIDLVVSGKEDIQAEIDSFRDQTDISYILSRLAVGDTSVLNQKVAMFGDFTNMPKTNVEILQLMIDKETQFAKLPADVRNQFDNDFRKWFASAGSDDWLSKMDAVLIKEKSVEDNLIEDSKDGSE